EDGNLAQESVDSGKLAGRLSNPANVRHSRELNRQVFEYRQPTDHFRACRILPAAEEPTDPRNLSEQSAETIAAGRTVENRSKEIPHSTPAPDGCSRRIAARNPALEETAGIAAAERLACDCAERARGSCPGARACPCYS